MNIFTHKTVVVKTLRKQRRVMVITPNIIFVILMFIFFKLGTAMLYEFQENSGPFQMRFR